MTGTTPRSGTTTSNVVLLARVDDPMKLVTVATYSTIVPVEHDISHTPDQVVDFAIEIAPPMNEWTRT